MNAINTDLLGTETSYVDTGKYVTRLIEVKNDKPPLFLFHGGGGHAEAYSRNMIPLSGACRPMAIDFIWHGLSSKPKFWPADPKAERHWLNQFTDQVLDLMDHLGLEKAVFEGESLGAWITADLAINHPDRTAGIVFNTAWGITFDPAKVEEHTADLETLRIASLAALNEPTYETIKARMDWLMPMGGVTDELIELRRAIWSRDDTKASLTEYYEKLFAPNINEFLFTEGDVSRITVPTFVLWTDHNPFQGLDAAHRLNELVEGSSLHIIENAGHWPQWEKPGEHDKAVSEFVRSL